EWNEQQILGRHIVAIIESWTEKQIDCHPVQLCKPETIQSLRRIGCLLDLDVIGDIRGNHLLIEHQPDPGQVILGWVLEIGQLERRIKLHAWRPLQESPAVTLPPNWSPNQSSPPHRHP